VTMLTLPFGFAGGVAGVFIASACWATGLGAQDACLRSGIAQVVSMNKRGSAFGAFNGVYGVAWFAGSVIMGMLYDHSIVALTVFGIVMQIAAAAFFLGLHSRVRAAAQAPA
jgi:predicted MFS family arabinose efflux permease